MKRRTTRVTQREQSSVDHQQQREESSLEFGTPEEAIRHDCRRISVPQTLAERLRKSIAAEPKATKAWWNRWFGR